MFMTNIFLCVTNIFQINIFLVFQHVLFETSVDLSNYYIKHVFLAFVSSFFCILKVLVIAIFIDQTF